VCRPVTFKAVTGTGVEYLHEKCYLFFDRRDGTISMQQKDNTVDARSRMKGSCPAAAHAETVRLGGNETSPSGARDVRGSLSRQAAG
jgi:hypothetical protein